MTEPLGPTARADHPPFVPLTAAPVRVTASPRGWVGRLVHRTVMYWPLKGAGITTFMFLFFWTYFWIIENVDRPATVMPAIWLDHWVGFVPSAFPVYLSLWLYVYLAPAFIGNLRALVWYGVWVSALCLFCLGIFWWFPTRIPPVNIDWSLYPGLALIKSVDGAGNAFPSLHVASAVFSLCWLHRIFQQLGAPVALRWLSLAQCLAIIWSTLATLQHVALDAFAGAAVGLAFAAASLAHIQDTRSEAERGLKG